MSEQHLNELLYVFNCCLIIGGYLYIFLKG
jgi:hypothetical protein